jgi:hypothetical protein
MSASGKSPIRPLLVGGAAGLILGCLIGWLAIGWQLWPVEYVGDAYTYELNEAEKMQYVASVADSYNLTRQVEVARQRFNAWTIEEKVRALARLFVDYQAQGKMQEAERAADLAKDLQREEGWDATLVSQVMSQVATEYVAGGEVGKAQAVSLFAQGLGQVSPAPPVAPVSTPAEAAPQAGIPIFGNVGALLRLCGVLLLVLLLIVGILLILRRRRSAERVGAARRPEEWTGAGPPPLLSRPSSYSLGMDNFDESFSIETEDGAFLGECGMGISEALGQETPRRVAAFEVWLFDKSDIRTVTKVLMSDFAYNDEERLRKKLASKGEPVLATPGATFTLETTSLIVEARVVEMEYGDGMPAFGYFNDLAVLLVARLKPGAEVKAEMPVPPGMGISS